MNKITAIGLTSGGLDSTLAALLLKKLGLDILLVCCTTPFFSHHNARRSADAIELPLKVIDITREHLSMLRNPPHGYGANMNPCIDCHTLMIRKAGELMEQEGAVFVFTGEVLGQRPFSQNRAALAKVAALSGLREILLRPLSARLLPETTPEKKGWVHREHLLDISGRSRKRQMALAEEFGLTDYPSPSGGCLLTEKAFSRRLKDLFDHEKEIDLRDIELLKVGRHFRLYRRDKIIVGRNESENSIIESTALPHDEIMMCIEYPGPMVLAPKGLSPLSRDLAASICASYSDAPVRIKVQVQTIHQGRSQSLTTMALPKKNFMEWMIQQVQ